MISIIRELSHDPSRGTNDFPTRRPSACRGAVLGVPLLLALSACAGVAKPESEAAVVAEEAPPKIVHNPGEGPISKLDEETLYKLLVAEIAGRRGQLDLSLESYLEVARRTRDPGVAERAVRIAVFARDEAKGLEAAKLWTEVAPESTDARQVYAALLIRAGEPDAAVAELRNAVPRFEGGPEEAYPRIADMLARERDKDAAVEVMEQVVAGEEGNAVAMAAFAQLLARAGELDRALGTYEKVMVLDPDDQQSIIIHARLLQRQGNTAAALDSLGQALERRPDAESVRLTYARLLVDAKRYDEARQQFERLSRDAPDNSDVRYALGLLLMQTNHLDAAEEQFRELISRRERVETSYYYLGQIAESRQDFDAALEAYEHVDEGEHRLNAQIRTAVLLADQDNVSAARAHLQGLRGDNVQEAIRIYRAEAEILAERERFQEAMLVYDGALDEFPDDTDLLYARAMLAEKMDLLQVLERDLRSILSREPNNADALNALGYTLADRTERYEEAYDLIKRAYDLKPEDHYIVDSMGWVLYRMGRYEEAVQHLRRAMELNDDPEIAAHLGEVLWVMGKKDAAREVWDTALKSTPDDKRLLDVMKRFEQ